MSKQLSGKTAIVTGGSSGIGRSIAMSMGELGATVYVVGRSEERVRAVAEEVDGVGGTGVSVAADLRDLSQVDDVVQRAVAETGTLNMMVNNAGLELGLGQSIIDADPADWREMFDVNVFALLRGAQTAIQAMRKGGFAGHIVNIGSIAGGHSGSGVYGSTKAAVRYLGEELRRELENDPIRIVQVLPGAVMTNFARSMSAERIKSLFDAMGVDIEVESGNILSEQAIERAHTAAASAFLSADDVARAVLYAVTQPITVDLFEIDIRPQRGTPAS